MQPSLSPPPEAHSLPEGSPPPFNVRAIGTPGSLGFRVLFENATNNALLSPWHDISLFGPNFAVACVCMTPSGTWVRYKVAPDEDANPIRARRRESFALEEEWRGANRNWPAEGPAGTNSALPAHYHDNAAVNICFLPQTMELSRQPSGNEAEDDWLEGQPMELVDIGADKIRVPGEAYLVRPLGAVAVPGEHGGTMWKIIAIAVEDSMGPMLRSCADVMVHLPGMVGLICEWFLRNSTGAPSRTDKDAPPIRLQPVEVVIAQEKIAEAHNAWTQYRLRAPKLGPSFMPFVEEDISASSEDDAKRPWSNYTSKSTLWRSCIPLSCPLPESSIPFDPAWLLGASDRDQQTPGGDISSPAHGTANRRSRRNSLHGLFDNGGSGGDEPSSRELKRAESTRVRRNSIHAPIQAMQVGAEAAGDTTIRELRRAASSRQRRKSLTGFGEGSRFPDFFGSADVKGGHGRSGLGLRTHTEIKSSFSSPDLIPGADGLPIMPGDWGGGA
eukprot:TRINITY_DN5598_c0_g1_i1.p1 TRINITY_DN5598_c0_g1~~TRINITY_DN5598_c0_g1_i1.p1  ORF type:complete len:500 (+),score=56.04 TRINITY_DN5598_c0_g1_i1:778-2277(+)